MNSLLNLQSCTVVELHAEWSRLWSVAHKEPGKKATPERAAKVAAAADAARDSIDAIDAEMRRRCVEYVERAGARVDQIPNPYEGFTNGLYEEWRYGAAAFLVGLPEADAMAHHSCYLRHAFATTREYVMRGREVVGILDDMQNARPDGAPHMQLLHANALSSDESHTGSRIVTCPVCRATYPEIPAPPFGEVLSGTCMDCGADVDFTTALNPRAYQAFLQAKSVSAPLFGLDPREIGTINPILKPHQQSAVRWAVQGGRRAIFAAFGLGKSMMQLEVLRLLIERDGGRALIVAPLGVRQEFKRDAEMLGQEIRFIRRIEEAGPTGLYITNYETVRDGKIDPREFTAASLDEASVLRGFGGVKTFREFMRMFAGDGRSLQKVERGIEVPYRFVATATPSPNEYIELLAYAAFLGVMSVSEAKTRFFKRDSTKADKLTLHAHKEREFWLWIASFCLFVQKPSDLCPCACHSSARGVHV